MKSEAKGRYIHGRDFLPYPAAKKLRLVICPHRNMRSH